MSHNYEEWSKERLVAHLVKLENTLRNTRRGLPTIQQHADQSDLPPTPSGSNFASHKATKEFRFSDHPTRKIALKFAYDGTHYNGLEHQRDVTPLPTVEETLWDALVKTRLVDPASDFDGHGWEKCGRTDRGVSAAGQVVSFWVRCKERGHPQRDAAAVPEAPGSTLHKSSNDQQALLPPDDVDGSEFSDGLEALSGWDEPPTNTTLPVTSPGALSQTQEFDYVSLLNGVLPLTLRVLSWSPVEPTFSARFNCRGRHYKYFFVSRGLNIEAMREGARRLVGEHDWRNLCKVDPAKFRLDAEGEDRWSFRRVVKSAEVNPVQPSSHSALSLERDDEGYGELFVFDLIGNAFLYNQVRHIMAILFLIGTGLEQPSIITALLNVDASNPYPPYKSDEPMPPIVMGKPTYQMADALPLILWDCQYDTDDVKWVGDIHVCSDDDGLDSDVQKKNPADVNGLYAELRSVHERSRVQTTLHAHFLKAASQYHMPPRELLPLPHPSSKLSPVPIPNGTVLGIPLGGGTHRNTRYTGGRGYVRLLDRKRLDEIPVIWDRWKNGKGAKAKRRGASEGPIIN